MKVKYHRPYGTEWEELDLETAMDMIAERAVPAGACGLTGPDGLRLIAGWLE